MRYVGKALALLVVVALLAGLGYVIYQKVLASKAAELGAGGGPAGAGTVAVEVAPIHTGNIVLRRTFTGTLRPQAQFDVASKVAGRIDRLLVDVGSKVERDAVVAQLDDAEFETAVAEARAEVAVAEAQLARAEHALEIAIREHERIASLRERGIASESELDQAATDRQARQAEVAVAEAQVASAEASLRSAEIRRQYTQVRASWHGGNATRVVGRRYVDEGDNVSANEPIVSVLDIDSLLAEVSVAERDYARLEVDQQAILYSDAYPDRTFPARIVRLSPQFRTESRQAPIELVVDNEEGLLKPGMFARLEVELDRQQDATLVPFAALTERGPQTVVFVVSDDGASVRQVAVEVGLVEDNVAQIVAPAISGRVVTLGQQLLKDGSLIRIPADAPPIAAPPAASPAPPAAPIAPAAPENAS